MGCSFVFVWMVALAALAPALAPALVETACADAFTAKVYDLDPKNPRLLYTLTSTETQEESGHTKIQATFRLPDGQLAASEAAEVAQSGGAGAGHLIRYTEEQVPPVEHGSVEVRGGRVYFSYFAAGKTKTDDEKLGDTLLVNPLTVPFLRANWDAIMKGDTIDARFAVDERRETVGFEFFKSGEERRGSRDVVIVTMKPSSFVIALARSPMTFVFDKATRRVLEFRGQVLPKRDGKSQDADIVYGN